MPLPIGEISCIEIRERGTASSLAWSGSAASAAQCVRVPAAAPNLATRICPPWRSTQPKPSKLNPKILRRARPALAHCEKPSSPALSARVPCGARRKCPGGLGWACSLEFAALSAEVLDSLLFFFEVADKAGKSQRDAPEILKLRARSMRYWVPAEDPLSHCWQLVAAQRSHEKSHDGMATS